MGTGYNDTQFDVPLGNAVRAERSRRGWNQYDVAKHLGFPRWCMWEVETRGVFRTAERMEAARRFVAGDSKPAVAPLGPAPRFVEDDTSSVGDIVRLLSRASTSSDVVALLQLADASGHTLKSILVGQR